MVTLIGALLLRRVNGPFLRDRVPNGSCSQLSPQSVFRHLTMRCAIRNRAFDTSASLHPGRPLDRLKSRLPVLLYANLASLFSS